LVFRTPVLGTEVLAYIYSAEAQKISAGSKSLPPSVGISRKTSSGKYCETTIMKRRETRCTTSWVRLNSYLINRLIVIGSRRRKGYERVRNKHRKRHAGK
jgi:hypothetical protein